MSINGLVAVVDYGVGNVGSIRNMLRKVGATHTVVTSPTELEAAGKIILPGVGAFDNAMQRLNDTGFLTTLTTLVLEQYRPVLGICLGMQLLTRRSEEGSLPGLGWVAADTVSFQTEAMDSAQRIPHMGWNTVTVKKPTPLFEVNGEEQRFYFTHSYHVVCDDVADVLTETHYGYKFVSAFSRGNIYGAQFHPEKSHRFGMAFLRHFVERC